MQGRRRSRWHASADRARERTDLETRQKARQEGGSNTVIDKRTSKEIIAWYENEMSKIAAEKNAVIADRDAAIDALKKEKQEISDKLSAFFKYHHLPSIIDSHEHEWKNHAEGLKKCECGAILDTMCQPPAIFPSTVAFRARMPATDPYPSFPAGERVQPAQSPHPDGCKCDLCWNATLDRVFSHDDHGNKITGSKDSDIDHRRGPEEMVIEGEEAERILDYLEHPENRDPEMERERLRMIEEARRKFPHPEQSSTLDIDLPDDPEEENAP